MNREMHYKSRYPLIDINWNPDELDAFLKRQYRQGFFSFALSLATILYDLPSWGRWNLWYLRNVGIPYYEKCGKEIRRLQTIREELVSIINELNAHLLVLGYWKAPEGSRRNVFPQFFLKLRDLKPPMDRPLIVRKIYRLEDALKLVDEEIDYYSSLITPFRRRKGRPAERVYILSALWSFIIRDSNYIHWKNIEGLLTWFKKRLGKSRCAFKIKPMPNPELIRRYGKSHSREFGDEINSFFVMRKPLPCIQIEFGERGPDFHGFSTSKCKKSIPRVIFPDGTKYYG